MFEKSYSRASHEKAQPLCPGANDLERPWLICNVQAKKEMKFRTIDWSCDSDAIRGLDTSFTTDRIYALQRTDLAFFLIEKRCEAPVTKRYEVALTKESVEAALVTIAACEGDVLLGFAVVKEEAWNRRAVVTDFYLDPQARRRGVGRKMMEEICRRVAGAPVRVLWIETQNVNLPAVKFYRSIGFEICGFDSALYDGPISVEVALFLSKSIQTKEPN